MDNTAEFSKQLKLKQINLSRSGQKILAGVSLDLPAQGVTVLLGANGAGKSSLLKVLAGISQMDSGSFELEGQAGVFLMPEPAVFYPHLTVHEQLQLVASQCGNHNAQAILDALNEWQLMKEQDKLTSHLSLGYRQRLSLAQLTVSGAHLWLLDEPMNGMDPAVMAIFKQRILNWKQRHQVVMATHIMHEAQDLADWVVVMHQGRVLYSAAYQPGTSFSELYQQVLDQHHQASDDNPVKPELAS